MTIKIKELAKELGVTTEDVMNQLRSLFIDVEDENSPVDDKIVGLVRIKLGGSSSSKKKAKEKAPPKTRAKKVSKKKAEEKDEEEKSSAKKKAAPKKTAKKKKEEEEKEEQEEKEKEKPAQKKGTRTKGGIQIVKKAEVIEPEPAPAPAPEPEPEPEIKPEEKKDQKGSIQVGIDELIRGAKKKSSVKKHSVFPKGKTKGKSTHNIEIIEKGQFIRPKARRTSRYGTSARSGGKKMEVVGEKQTSQRKTALKIEIHVPANIRTIAPKINTKPGEIIQYLMGNGALVNINQDLEEDLIRDIFEHFGYELEIAKTIESIEKELVTDHHLEKDKEVESRAPVVTFMGHVDHGKTSLLDYIRNTMVTKGEKGGITQHIGAYKVEMDKGSVTFLDTPGHAAFTAMRARGATATDVVVLVVAADDGVMPQTKEAIDHARAAEVPIVVAINKCDLPGANPERVRQELQKEGLSSEDWGGDTIMVEVSAITGEGVDKLVEMLMLESEMLELKANTKLKARGVVIESKKTSGQGVVVTLLVQNGTLRSGDIIICGSFYGRAKAMLDSTGQKVAEALPSTPVEILGLQGVPEAGEEFFIVKDEKKARTLAALKQDENRRKSLTGSQRVSLEDLHEHLMAGNIKELKIILKADVQGSIEALEQSLQELSTDEVKVNIIHSAVGNINESDIMLALVSSAVPIGFHVKMESKAEEIAKSEKLDFYLYDIIYEAIADVKAGMEGLLEPEEKEIFQGSAKVLEVFPSKNGKAAGCMITKGTIHRKDNIRIKRAQEVVFEGEILSLKRFKDDVRDVKDGFECGISIKGFNKINKNDIIEAFIIEKIARRLSS